MRPPIHKIATSGAGIKSLAQQVHFTIHFGSRACEQLKLDLIYEPAIKRITDLSARTLSLNYVKSPSNENLIWDFYKIPKPNEKFNWFWTYNVIWQLLRFFCWRFEDFDSTCSLRKLFSGNKTEMLDSTVFIGFHSGKSDKTVEQRTLHFLS